MYISICWQDQRLLESNFSGYQVLVSAVINNPELRQSSLNIFKPYSFLLTLLAAQWKKLQCYLSLREWVGQSSFLLLQSVGIIQPLSELDSVSFSNNM